MGLLEEVSQMASETDVPIARLLLKCTQLAHELEHELLMTWAVHELEGFPDDAVPDYRKTVASPYAMVTNGFRTEELSIPLAIIPQEFHESATNRAITQSASSLESIDDSTTNILPLNNAYKRIVEAHVKGYQCAEAYSKIPPGAMTGILTAIRSRVMQFTFSIKRDYPEFASDPEVAALPPTPVLNHYYNVLVGQGSAVSFGSGTALVRNDVRQIVAGDFDSLAKYFSSQGVEQEDIDELREIVTGSRAADLNDEDSRIGRWASAVAGKVSKGSKAIATTAARELILLSIRYYFGEVTTWKP